MKTILIRTDNTAQFVETTGLPAYEEFQRITGQGWAEYVYVTVKGQSLVVVCDDEGVLKDLPYNALPSHLYGVQRHGCPIVGDVILMKPVVTSSGPDFAFFCNEEIVALALNLSLVAAQYGIDFRFINKEEEDGRK